MQQAIKRGFSVKNISIIGAGQMGSGIGIVAAHKAKLHVKFLDVNDKVLENSFARIETYFNRQVEKGQMTKDESLEIISRLSFTVYPEDLHATDFLIEAVNEDFDLKKKMLTSVEKHVTNPNAIFASNTSSIPITKLAAIMQRPDKFIGMHFFNPVPVMNLVEIITAIQTDDHTLNETRKLAALMQKESVRANDVPGFITNRVLMPWINEAIFALQENIASIEDIDKAMKLGTNVPMGPLTLADFIGLDTCLAIMNVLYHGHGNQKFAPCPLLVKYVDAGRLGRKSGIGFYDYTKKK